MATFDLTAFTKTLIIETLFYDDEFGTSGNLSLIDPEAGKELFLIYLDPEAGAFKLEEATEWDTSDDIELIGYAMAMDSVDRDSYATPEEAANAVLELCSTQNLRPSFTLLFDEDEA